MEPLPPVTIDTVNGARMAFQVFDGDAASGDSRYSGDVRDGGDSRDRVPAIVLVAGGASTMDWWDDGFCRLLASGDAATGTRRVIRYDLRDTGQSETVAPGAATYSGADLVDDLAALIQHVGAVPAHVVGLSSGGGMTQNLALRRPDLLASITLMSTSPVGTVDRPLPPPTPEMAASFGSSAPPVDWADDDAVAAAAITTERLYSGSIPVDVDRIRRIALASAARTASPDSAENHWSASDPPGLRTDIESITLPTLVVHGSDDPLFPLPHGEALADIIPGARLVVVPGMGHQFPPPPTWPQIVGALLRHTAR